LFFFISKIFPQEKANENPTKNSHPTHSNAGAFEQRRGSESRLVTHFLFFAVSKAFGRRGWFGGGGGYFFKNTLLPLRFNLPSPTILLTNTRKNDKIRR
ncbi:MAG: hypothetical protein IJW49_11080, partial [Clostridia bacterium]|nr:hypothetical protein [Clostridia bacterium]